MDELLSEIKRKFDELNRQLNSKENELIKFEDKIKKLEIENSDLRKEMTKYKNKWSELLKKIKMEMDKNE